VELASVRHSTVQARAAAFPTMLSVELASVRHSTAQARVCTFPTTLGSKRRGGACKRQTLHRTSSRACVFPSAQIPNSRRPRISEGVNTSARLRISEGAKTEKHGNLENISRTNQIKKNDLEKSKKSVWWKSEIFNC